MKLLALLEQVFRLVMKVISSAILSFDKLTAPLTVTLLKQKITRSTENVVSKLHKIFMLPTVLALEH